jgi:hypothetical protein
MRYPSYLGQATDGQATNFNVMYILTLATICVITIITFSVSTFSCHISRSRDLEKILKIEQSVLASDENLR